MASDQERNSKLLARSNQCDKARPADTDLSIIIVTWNCRQYVLDCLASIQNDLPPLSAEVIVVDNASSDGTPDAIAEEFPEVQLIRGDSNLGFARGNNVAIQRARGRYVCLVNPDVKVLAPCFGPLVRFLEEHSDVGLAGPAMLGANQKQARSYMRYPSLWNAFCRATALDNVLGRVPGFGGQLMRGFNPKQISDVDVLNGWFWMVRREALATVGLLDERFFMYGEDIDWCRRFHALGWRVMFFPIARAIHYGGACSSNEPVRFSVEMERANLQYWEKYHGRLAQSFYLALCGLHHLIRAVAYFLVAPLSSHTTEVHAKVKRSVACIRWLTRQVTTPARPAA